MISPADWSVANSILPHGVVCRLTILGITKEDVGDYPTDAGDPNRLTTAAMQAFKRACALYGLGRYLTSCPRFGPTPTRPSAPSRIRAALCTRSVPSPAGLAADSRQPIDR